MSGAYPRRFGWRQALEAAGLVAPEPYRGDWSPDSGYRCGLQWGRDPRVTAVFASSDEMAFGFIAGVKAAGRRVPGDISVVGVDDVLLSAYCDPPLTTVAQPYDRTGAAAVRMVLRQLGADTDVDDDPVSDFTVTIRASTAPPGGLDAVSRRGVESPRL